MSANTSTQSSPFQLDPPLPPSTLSCHLWMSSSWTSQLSYAHGLQDASVGKVARTISHSLANIKKCSMPFSRSGLRQTAEVASRWRSKECGSFALRTVDDLSGGLLDSALEPTQLATVVKIVIKTSFLFCLRSDLAPPLEVGDTARRPHRLRGRLRDLQAPMSILQQLDTKLKATCSDHACAVHSAMTVF